VVRGPVVILPSGAIDQDAAAGLLAWMMSPEIAAEAAVAHALLPASRRAAQDPRFQDPGFPVFLDLLAHPNAAPAAVTPVRPALNQALEALEAELVHSGGDPASRLDALQAELDSP
jgi:ABC-type glycerol-3-phosphate transport system substrate-binding protein